MTYLKHRFATLSVFFVFGAVHSHAQMAVSEADFGSGLWVDPIEVWGDRQTGDPGAYSVLDAEQVFEVAADHPAEILNKLPGVNIQMNSGQEHLIALRSPVLTGGAGQGSFLVLENGVPTRSPAFGNVNSLLEPHHDLASAIEVVRGPGSAQYGSNAVHGLINVLLPDGTQANGLQMDLSGSTLGRYKTNLLAANGGGEYFAASLQSDTGWRDNTGTFQAKLSGASTFSVGEWDATAWASASHLEQETAGFIEGEKAYRDTALARTNPNPEAYRDAVSARAAIRFERKLGEGALTVTPFARVQEMAFRQHFLPYRGIEENGHTGWGVMSSYEQDVSDTLTLRIGGDVDIANGYLSERQPEPFGFFPGDTRFPVGIHYDYEVDTSVGALWTEFEWSPAPRLTVLAGLRGEAHEYDYNTDAPVGINGRFNVPEDRTDTFRFAAPKLGLIYETGAGIALYANYGRGARAPQASDLYRLQSLQGVAEADVETLDSFEIGARGAVLGGDLVFDLAAYTADKKNFFFRDSDGLNVPNGETRHQGIEAAFDWTLSDAISVHGTAGWADHTYEFDRIVGNSSQTILSGNPVDTAPEWMADIGVVWAVTERLETELSAEYIGEYATDPASTRDYPGHTVTNLRAAYVFDEGLESFIIVRNLFDLAYADRADFAFGDDRYFPGEPLNATFGVRKRF